MQFYGGDKRKRDTFVCPFFYEDIRVSSPQKKYLGVGFIKSKKLDSKIMGAFIIDYYKSKRLERKFVLLTVLVFGVFYFLLVIIDDYEQKRNVALLELQNKMIIKSQSDAEHIFMI